MSCYCRQIFEKYFRRGSSTEVYMPTEVRNGVLGGLLLGDQHVYDRAQAVALDVLLLEVRASSGPQLWMRIRLTLLALLISASIWCGRALRRRRAVPCPKS